MSYIDPYELVFTNDQKGGIHTGGISVKSIMMGKGISPIRTLNTNTNNNDSDDDEQKGGNVSDLFGGSNIVVPNWAFTSGKKTGSLIEQTDHSTKNESDSDEDSVVAGDLHDKLLGLIEETDTNINKNKSTKKGGRNNKKPSKTRKFKNKIQK